MCALLIPAHALCYAGKCQYTLSWPSHFGRQRHKHPKEWDKDRNFRFCVSCGVFLMGILIQGDHNTVIHAECICQLISLPHSSSRPKAEQTRNCTSHYIPLQPKRKPCKSCFPTFSSLTIIIYFLRHNLHTIPAYDETALQKHTHRPGKEALFVLTGLWNITSSFITEIWKSKHRVHTLFRHNRVSMTHLFRALKAICLYACHWWDIGKETV